MKSFLMITGATGGLGSAFVLEAARRGYDLLLTDRAPEGTSFAGRLAEKFNISVVYQPCDLADDSAREKLLAGFKAEGYRFWGLINVAGLDNEGGFLERNRAQILKILQINILATMDVTHGILPLRDPDQQFRLINVCSMASFYAMPFKATYAASKRFLLDFSRALREEIKPFGSVTALCPSGMPTTVECMRSMFAQGFLGTGDQHEPGGCRPNYDEGCSEGSVFGHSRLDQPVDSCHQQSCAPISCHEVRRQALECSARQTGRPACYYE